MFKKFSDWFKGLFWSKELEISIIGLQNAGKTTFVNTLSTGAFQDDTIPTIGFNHRTVKKGGVSIKMWDLGGQPRFRESWEKYCRTADVIIYIVDAADLGSIDISKTQLHQLLSWPSLNEIPLLILGNKNDLNGALGEEELVKVMELEKIKDRKVACYSVSAKTPSTIDITLKWLSGIESKKKAAK